MINLNDLTKNLNIESIDEVVAGGGKGKGGSVAKGGPLNIRGWCDPQSSSSSSVPVTEPVSDGSNNGGSGD